MKKSYSFGAVPMIRHSRSSFNLSHNVKTTANVGDLIPFLCQEVYPGDTFKDNVSIVTRLASSYLKPVMDSLFLDTWFFYVPSHILYKDAYKVFGERDNSSDWIPSGSYQMPLVGHTPSGHQVGVGTLGDYFGLPVAVSSGDYVNADISVLPFRAYAHIYNDYFRDENNVPSIFVRDDQGAMQEASEYFNSNAFGPNNYMGKPAKVSKMHDYFTTCLPNTQKGAPVNLPLNGVAPIVTGTMHEVGANPVGFNRYTAPSYNMDFILDSTGRLFSKATSSGDVFSSNTGIYRTNLVADLSNASGATINDFRYALALQALLEKDARSGTRMTEILQSHWHVISPDSRLQRPEYLGGSRMALNVQQVAQTAPVSGSSNVGDVGAYSLTNGSARFSKAFVEHGYIIGLFAIRQFHSYGQGVEKFWMRKERLDFYDPTFANIGEEPVFAQQLYGKATKGQVFGYNEAWADLRFRPSHVTGAMRPELGSSSLGIWNFADNYSNTPVLGQTFIEETPTYVDRTLAVPSSSMPQFILDMYVKQTAYRELPTYSVPSLIEHS